jgi:hypothetical protein
MDEVVATLRVGVLTLDCMCAVTPQVARLLVFLSTWGNHNRQVAFESTFQEQANTLHTLKHLKVLIRVFVIVVHFLFNTVVFSTIIIPSIINYIVWGNLLVFSQ